MTEIPTLVRTPVELKAARAALGLSTEALARMVLIDDGSSVRRWEAGNHAIPGPVTVILETAMNFLHQRKCLLKQLEMLQSGKMRPSTWGADADQEDATTKSIDGLTLAIKSFDDALAILTRQPPTDGSNSTKVHWYTLRRLTPQYAPGQKDEWTLPGETSPERALAYFQKEGGFNHHLAICESHAQLPAEFLLEQREVLRAQFGRSQRLRAGDLVKTMNVRRTESCAH